MNKKKIIELLKRDFPEIYVDIISHDAFGQEFQVRCFGVKRSAFRSVRRKIIAINRELFPEYDVSLISIVFTMESTREHFPEIAEEMERSTSCCNSRSFDWFFDEIYLPQVAVWEVVEDVFEDTVDSGVSNLMGNPNKSGYWQTDASNCADESYLKAA